MEMLLKNPEEEIHFIDGSEYRGTWNVLGMEGIGKYVLPHNAAYEGEIRDGTFHGHGSLYWPRRQRMDGTWYQGGCDEKRYIFDDGLTFRSDDWEYCKFPDRRYHTCIKHGLKPAGATLRTNDRDGFVIPPKCYDTGVGIFNPHTNYITSYRDPSKVLEIPNTTFVRWIKSNCQKAWSEPTGHREDLYENWYSEKFDKAILSRLLPFSNNSPESWWRRLTTFQQDRTWNQVKAKRHCSCVESNF